MSRKKVPKPTKFPGYLISVKRATVDVIVKPCPFCGPLEKLKAPFLKKDGSAMSDEDGPCWIQCSGCCARGPESDDGGLAADAWNKRAGK